MEYRNYVYVVDSNDEPCNPINEGFARKLLNNNQALIINHDPLVIKRVDSYLKEKEPDNKYVLKIDMGYKYIGFSVTNDKYEVLSGQVELLDGMSKRLKARQESRRIRRSRLRHRKNKTNDFKSKNNPMYKNGNEDGWFPPSIRHKMDTHQRLVDKIASWIPINHIELEVSRFNIQQMKADLKDYEMHGVDYQNGEMKGYDNVKLYVKERDKYTCQNCGQVGGVLEVHHRQPRIEGGSNRPGNLVTLCKNCHHEAHKNNNHNKLFEKLLSEVKDDDYKDATFMNTVRWAIFDSIGEKFDVEAFYGYETYRNRNKANLPKFHHNDAVCINEFNNISLSKTLYLIKQNRCNDRKIEDFHDAVYIDSRDGKEKKGNVLSLSRKGDATSKRSTRPEDIDNQRVYRKEKKSKGYRKTICHTYCLKNGDLIKIKSDNLIVEVKNFSIRHLKSGKDRYQLFYIDNREECFSDRPSISLTPEEYNLLKTTGECSKVSIVRTRRGLIWRKCDRVKFENKYGDQYHIEEIDKKEKEEKKQRNKEMKPNEKSLSLDNNK